MKRKCVIKKNNSAGSGFGVSNVDMAVGLRLRVSLHERWKTDGTKYLIKMWRQSLKEATANRRNRLNFKEVVVHSSTENRRASHNDAREREKERK